MSQLELAKSYELELCRTYPDASYKIWCEYNKDSPLFHKVIGTVLYVGSGRDLSTLLLFPNAGQFVHIDYDPRVLNLGLGLQLLQNLSILSELEAISQKEHKTTYSFRQFGRKKQLVEICANLKSGMPTEAQSDLEAIYFFAVPYPETIRVIQTIALPYLKVGGIFEGSYPYANGIFEGAMPETIGLNAAMGTWIKVKDMDSATLHKQVRDSHHGTIQP